MTKLEEVARAICKAELPTDNKWELCLPAAIAAIEAMRDPSHEMMRAMFEAMFEAKFDGTTAPMIGAGFDAAIDAALTGEEKWAT